jgi:cytochrome c oxidase subunit III
MNREYSAVHAGPAIFPGYNQSHNAPIWWGINGLILIEVVVFSSFIATYFYLAFGHPQWPVAGVSPPDLLLPIIGTVVLLASSASMYYADNSIKKDNVKGLMIGLAISIALSTLFLVLKVFEYADRDYRWHSHPYGSIVWIIVFFHSAHVVSVGLKTIVVLLLAWRGFFNRHNRIAITVNGFYWHFVVFVWVPLFATIYISPRL